MLSLSCILKTGKLCLSVYLSAILLKQTSLAQHRHNYIPFWNRYDPGLKIYPIVLGLKAQDRARAPNSPLHESHLTVRWTGGCYKTPCTKEDYKSYDNSYGE